jgi:hypothetical protein
MTETPIGLLRDSGNWIELLKKSSAYQEQVATIENQRSERRSLLRFCALSDHLVEINKHVGLLDPEEAIFYPISMCLRQNWGKSKRDRLVS